jgi:GT2 family glycosyltransferase
VNRPELAGVVIAWRAAADVEALVADWPRDERFELVIVDQSGELDATALAPARIVRPERNLGFAGGANLGARETTADLLLFLNPDARPAEGALAALVDGFAREADVAGLVPRLLGFDGTPQFAWQLRRLPTPFSLLAHAFFVAPEASFAAEPPAGTAIEQPAAAALALRRASFAALGGFDERFFPAWWEDVDLARRLRDSGARLAYCPTAVVRHRLGSTVGEIGYGLFLESYDRNLLRYLEKHHGRRWGVLFRMLALVGALARAIALPIRKPRRARSRGEALAALVRIARGAFTRWDGGGEAAR